MTRTGENPSRHSSDLPRYGTMRVIIPVFVPYSGDYFEDGLEIVRILLDSLNESIDERVRVTVVDNASRPDVVALLESHLASGTIDRLIRNQQNRGKVDAVLAELRATFEPISVVVDADVVFRSGWVDSVLASLAAFPECGMLSLSPTPGWHAASSVLATACLAGARIIATSIADDADMGRFAASIGRRHLEMPVRGRHLAVEREGAALTVGFGHFAFAVRREVVDALPSRPSRSARGGTDAAYLEHPADRAGWWCLSMSRAAVHHIGNTLDDAERRTIEEFRSTVLTDVAGVPTRAARPRAARVLAAPGRHRIAALIRRTANLPSMSRRLAPNEELQLREGSALRVVRSSAQALDPR